MRSYKEIHELYGPTPGPCWFKLFDPRKSIHNGETGVEYFMHTWKNLFHMMKELYTETYENPELGGLMVRTGVLPISFGTIDANGTPPPVVLSWTLSPTSVGAPERYRISCSIMDKRVVYRDAHALPTMFPFPTPHSAWTVSSPPVYNKVYDRFMKGAEIPSWFNIPAGLPDDVGWCPRLRTSYKCWSRVLGETPEYMENRFDCIRQRDAEQRFDLWSALL